MWKLYDDLYIGIPSGITIDGCVIGDEWVTVRAAGSIGIARMLEKPCRSGDEFIGAYLRDTACHLHWDSLTKAAVGVAALNAWYNTPERVAGLDGKGEFGYTHVPEHRAAVVGECPCFAKSGFAAEAFPLPMDKDFDRAAYAALKDFDVVIVSGDALTTCALPGLLEIVGEGGKVVLDGVSVPASALFFAFDMPIRRINGYYRRFDNTMETAARLGLRDIEPGMLPFTVVPQELHRVVESDAAKRFTSSPYQASKFNPQAFNKWEGYDYDKAEWSKIFKC